MKKVFYCLIFFLYLLPVYSQDYSYKVFSEDGIYVRNIKNDKYTEKLVLKFKEKQPPYIEYYNNKRIKGKLKGMSPVNYRIHSLSVA